MKSMTKKELWDVINSDNPEQGYNYLYHELVKILSQKYGVRISKMSDIFKYSSEQDIATTGTIVTKSFNSNVYAKYNINGKCRCQKCGTTEDLSIHHLESKKTCPEDKYNINNVTVLCRDCHAKEHGIFKGE
jgi:5-methylcytosine-specific restriction endonuclease McrA